MRSAIITGKKPAACTNADCPIKASCRRPGYSLKEVWPFRYENDECAGFIPTSLSAIPEKEAA